MSEYKAIVGVDFDGVVGNLMTPWLNAYNADSGDNLKYEDIDRWNISELVLPGWERKIFDYLIADGVYAEVPAIDGAHYNIHLLRSMGYRVVFVSSCTKTQFFDKIEWLNHRGFWKEVTTRSPEDFVAAYSKELIDVDLIVDDNLETIQKFSDRGILFTQPWNISGKVPNRVFHWNEVPPLVELLYEELGYGESKSENTVIGR